MAASSFSENILGQIEGWIIDLYAKNDRMVIWLKTQDDEAVQLTDIWKRCFYVAGDYGDLIKLANQLCIEGMSYEEKFVKPNDSEPSRFLRIPVRIFREAEKIAEHVLIRGRYALYELYKRALRQKWSRNSAGSNLYGSTINQPRSTRIYAQLGSNPLLEGSDRV